MEDAEPIGEVLPHAVQVELLFDRIANGPKNPWAQKVPRELPPRTPWEPPIIPPLPFSPSMPAPWNPVVARCGECQLDLHQIMHYVCSNARCPTGLGPTIC